MSNTDMKDRADAYTQEREAHIKRHMRRMGSIQQLHAIQEELALMSQQSAGIFREWERIGETDANAGKIIQLAQVLERTLTLLMVASRSVLDLETD